MIWLRRNAVHFRYFALIPLWTEQVPIRETELNFWNCNGVGSARNVIEINKLNRMIDMKFEEKKTSTNTYPYLLSSAWVNAKRISLFHKNEIKM